MYSMDNYKQEQFTIIAMMVGCPSKVTTLCYMNIPLQYFDLIKSSWKWGVITFTRHVCTMYILNYATDFNTIFTIVESISFLSLYV